MYGDDLNNVISAHKDETRGICIVLPPFCPRLGKNHLIVYKRTAHLKWTFLGTWMPELHWTLLWFKFFRVIHNPSFVGDLLGRKVKLVQILNIKGQKSKCEKRCVPLGCPWSHTDFFPLLMISFFLTNNPVLSHIFFFGEEVEAFDQRQAFDHPRQDRPAWLRRRAASGNMWAVTRKLERVRMVKIYA